MSTSVQPVLPEFAPFRIEPSFVGRVWGFHDLRPWYDRVAENEPIGEVWLSGDECRVASGPQAGKTLGDIFTAEPEKMLGKAASGNGLAAAGSLLTVPCNPQAAPCNGSPLLLKVIFAKEKLSVQVHPDDRMAQKYGQPRGKTECWYALAAEPGAQVACGLKTGVTLDKIKDGIHAGNLEESLNMLPVAAGEVIFVDAGTVHAIWPGSILLETQQNCDVTYRMYDYGRPRELHIEKSLEAVKLDSHAGKIASKIRADRTVLVEAEYFCIERIPVAGSRLSATLRGEDEPEEGLSYLFAAAGAGRITGSSFEPVELPTRGIVAVPAAAPEFALENLGALELIRITPRWPVKSA